MTPSLLWFRNDLRLHDHAALHAAIEAGPVLPVFVLDLEAAGRWARGGASRWWLHHSLDALGHEIAGRGGRLVLVRGRAETELARLADAVGAGTVFAGPAVEPWARAQEQRVADTLARDGRALVLHRTVSLFDPEAIRTKAGSPYGVYTPFSRACFAAGVPAPLPPPSRLTTPSRAPKGEMLSKWGLLPTKPDWAGGLRATWTPGEFGARARLEAFTGSVLDNYDVSRNLTAQDGTSMLSPHLHFGEISPAQIWHAASAAADTRQRGLTTYLKELLWREFSIHLLWHHPELPEQPLREEFAAMPWRHDPAGLAAWQRGRTGVPMVDAAMRQLWQIGWMHNRARMIVASFLVKHLLIPWQDGEAWFWDTLVDADLANNSANWQWVAGCGADAAPYFRVFNPVLQGVKFDPEGEYVRRFVPELAKLPTKHIHAPWDAPPDVLRKAGVRLGETYPEPLIGLSAGRGRALAAYRSVSQATR